MKKKAGFTLIEVLIAMLVLTLGLLGLAGLQARGLKNNVSAYNRGQATQLAYDMADRIRANIAEAKKSAASTYDTDVLDPAAATVQNNCNSTTKCSVSELAQNDLYEWNLAITNPDILPNGNGQIDLNDKTITIKPATGAALAVTKSITVGTIVISWDDDRDGDRDGDDPSFQMSFQL